METRLKGCCPSQEEINNHHEKQVSVGVLRHAKCCKGKPLEQVGATKDCAEGWVSCDLKADSGWASLRVAFKQRPKEVKKGLH